MPKIHHGEALRRYLRLNDISVKAFMLLVDKSRQTVYDWFDIDKFEQDVWDKVTIKGKISPEILKTKIDTDKNQTQTDQSMHQEVKEIIESNKHYRATIDRQLAIIEQLTGMHNRQSKQNSG